MVHTLAVAGGTVVGHDSTGGRVMATTDRRSWASAPGPTLTLLSWDEAGGLWGSAADGTVHRRGVDGAWERRAGLGAEPEALLVNGRTLYAAAPARGILQSDDGGSTWRLRYRTGAP